MLLPKRNIILLHNTCHITQYQQFEIQQECV